MAVSVFFIIACSQHFPGAQVRNINMRLLSQRKWLLLLKDEVHKGKLGELFTTQTETKSKGNKKGMRLVYILSPIFFKEYFNLCKRNTSKCLTSPFHLHPSSINVQCTMIVNTSRLINLSANT